LILNLNLYRILKLQLSPHPARVCKYYTPETLFCQIF